MKLLYLFNDSTHCNASNKNKLNEIKEKINEQNEKKTDEEAEAGKLSEFVETKQNCDAKFSQKTIC